MTNDTKIGKFFEHIITILIISLEQQQTTNNKIKTANYTNMPGRHHYDRHQLLIQLIRVIPKVELHLHLEGTLEPELVFRLAKRNNIDLSSHYANEGSLRSRYEKFTDLDSFLELYYQTASVLCCEQDFYDLTMAYLERAHCDNIIHTEVFFDPQCHKIGRGLSFEICANGILSAMDDAEARFGINSNLIVCFLRHLSEESAIATWNEMCNYIRRHPESKSRIIGVGLDSSEIDNPPRKFKNLFDIIHYSSMNSIGKEIHIVAHAGEEGPPSYIYEALDQIHAERIDHGIACLKDDSLMKRLQLDHVPLTVCPLSNLRLKVVDCLENHNLKKILDMGLNASINSDDPAYFGGYLIDNYCCVTESLGLDEYDILKLAQNAIESAFICHERKAELLQILRLVSEPILQKLEACEKRRQTG